VHGVLVAKATALGAANRPSPSWMRDLGSWCGLVRFVLHRGA